MALTDGIRSRAREARVALGLGRIGLYERLDPRLVERWRAPLRRYELWRVSCSLEPLKQWERVSPSSYATYTDGANAARIRRLVKLIGPGRRILDVGIGFGYVTGVLLRDAPPKHYCGIDLKPLFIEAARDMQETNNLTDRSCTLEVRNVFELDREFTGVHRPDLVLMLEVLEHIPDPTAALARINKVVDPGTELIFTVPLRGRLDGVWGHVSVFDRWRLERICADAGLEIQRAEPLFNTWSLVVAKTTGRQRLQLAPERRDRGSRYDTFRLSRVSADSEDHRRAGDPEDVRLLGDRSHVRCEIPADGDEPAPGGVRFPVNEPLAVRIELKFEPMHSARRFGVRALSEEGEELMEWHTSSDHPHLGARQSYVFAPGQPARGMTHSGATNPRGVRWIEVCVWPRRGVPSALTVYRVAYLGEPLAPVPKGSQAAASVG